MMEQEKIMKKHLRQPWYKTHNKLIQRDFQTCHGFCKKTAKAAPALKAPDEDVSVKKNKHPTTRKHFHLKKQLAERVCGKTMLVFYFVEQRGIFRTVWFLQ